MLVFDVGVVVDVDGDVGVDVDVVVCSHFAHLWKYTVEPE